MTSVNPLDNVLRDDVAGESILTADALKNAPKKNEAFIKVPKVLG
jgi:aspartyl/glutamyl-tRNA(Asn/Gln) amidotransferase C subunit